MLWQPLKTTRSSGISLMLPVLTVAIWCASLVQWIKMPHSLSEINEEHKTGICSICGLVRVILRDKNRIKLNAKYRCGTTHKANNLRFSYPYRKYKKDYCEKCGFIPEHQVQLDVDHIDGNNKNNELSNLQTLCANCHRLKTFLNQDGSYKKGYIQLRDADKTA